VPQHEISTPHPAQHASISRKAQDIRPFLVMDVLERAQAIERETGVNVIHLEVGEPDFDTPPAIIDAAIGAM
jgi:(5-formylfuran-3-yl)methyl phosphate transaminase